MRGLTYAIMTRIYFTRKIPQLSPFSHGEDGEKKEGSGTLQSGSTFPLITKGVKIQPGVSNRRCVCVCVVCLYGVVVCKLDSLYVKIHQEPIFRYRCITIREQTRFRWCVAIKNEQWSDRAEKLRALQFTEHWALPVLLAYQGLHFACGTLHLFFRSALADTALHAQPRSSSLLNILIIKLPTWTAEYNVPWCPYLVWKKKNASLVQMYFLY